MEEMGEVDELGQVLATGILWEVGREKEVEDTGMWRSSESVLERTADIFAGGRIYIANL